MPRKIYNRVQLLDPLRACVYFQLAFHMNRASYNYVLISGFIALEEKKFLSFFHGVDLLKAFLLKVNEETFYLF